MTPEEAQGWKDYLYPQGGETWIKIKVHNQEACWENLRLNYDPDKTDFPHGFEVVSIMFQRNTPTLGSLYELYGMIEQLESQEWVDHKSLMHQILQHVQVKIEELKKELMATGVNKANEFLYYKQQP